MLGYRVGVLFKRTFYYLILVPHHQNLKRIHELTSLEGQTKSNLCCLVSYANCNPSLLHNVGDVECLMRQVYFLDPNMI